MKKIKKKQIKSQLGPFAVVTFHMKHNIYLFMKHNKSYDIIKMRDLRKSYHFSLGPIDGLPIQKIKISSRIFLWGPRDGLPIQNLRSKMSQSRLSNLSILSIENDEAKTIDTSIIIKQFAAVNAVREKKF